jgi:AraC family transcriptional regulator, regulatory protein of adaptative response / methylated-DNA-[protein]-cysteine methyltransferase
MNSQGLWNAVITRDAGADGLFVYAVSSTKIYCRPSCPSRRPRRERVEFFPAPGMARARGYRACRRCHPDEPTTGAPAVERVRRVCEAVARWPDIAWTSAALARAGGTSTVQLQRAFRSTLGLSPRDYVAACRRRRFLARLKAGGRVTDAVYDSGYGSSSRAYDGIRLPGMTPATYGRGGRGAHLDWLVVPSGVGRILVAATARGLCFVEVGSTVDALVSRLRAEFPLAEVAGRPSPALRPLADAALAVVNQRPLPSSLPVDIRGTAFQWRVWKALTSIPRGETRSYADVARSIGASSSSRAVARACATNPLALVVPCHRVTPAAGGTGGYRWGVRVKRQLLDGEEGR